MKHHEINFEYFLPNDLTLDITARLTPGRPEEGPTYDCGGQPAEGPECEIIESILVYEDLRIPFPVDEFSFYDDIEEKAFEAATEEY